MTTPISPWQARANRAPNAADLEASIAKINKYVSEREPTTDRRWYYAVDNLDAPMRDALVSAYQAAGWSAGISYDQRDGVALVLQEPR